jgi:drug/metabolite transporter (DMT)-like permease
VNRSVATGAGPENSTSRLQAGILLMIGSGFLFAMLDTSAKYLSADHHVMQIVWGRYFFSLLLLPLIIGRINPIAVIRTERLGLQVVRSLLLLAATFLFFTAIRYIPLADATAIAFVSPLLVTVLSVPMLGENVGGRRWAAVVVGLVGAVIIIRPGFGDAGWVMALPLATALAYSLYQITTRMLTTTDATTTIFFYTGIVGTGIMLFVVPFFWSTPSLGGWLVMVGLGLLGGLGHFLVIQAFLRAPASALSPFSFITIVWTTITGFLVFGDVPDLPTIAGAAIIIASGMFVFYREGTAGRVQPADDTIETRLP